MQYWLLKTEPATYSWEDLVRDTKQKGGEEWSGVRNYEARNNMRKMKVGDQVFIYHSGDKEIVGIGRIVKEAHPDSTDETGMWDCVDVVSVRLLKQPITLDEMKNIPACRDMILIRKGRLSVQPVKVEEWMAVIKKGDKK